MCLSPRKVQTLSSGLGLLVTGLNMLRAYLRAALGELRAQSSKSRKFPYEFMAMSCWRECRATKDFFFFQRAEAVRVGRLMKLMAASSSRHVFQRQQQVSALFQTVWGFPQGKLRGRCRRGPVSWPCRSTCRKLMYYQRQSLGRDFVPLAHIVCICTLPVQSYGYFWGSQEL